MNTISDQLCLHSRFSAEVFDNEWSILIKKNGKEKKSSVKNQKKSQDLKGEKLLNFWIKNELWKYPAESD